jgi:hypothetical protein
MQGAPQAKIGVSRRRRIMATLLGVEARARGALRPGYR